MLNHLARNARVYVALAAIAVLGWFIRGWLASHPLDGEPASQQADSSGTARTGKAISQPEDTAEYGDALSGARKLTEESDYAQTQIQKQENFLRSSTQDALDRHTPSSAAPATKDPGSSSER